MSSAPHTFRLYVDNLDVESQALNIDYLKEFGINVMSCKLLHSSHLSNYTPPSASFNVIIDSIDKEKMLLSPNVWETGIIIRP